MPKLEILKTRWAISTYANLVVTVLVAAAGFASVVVLARHLPVVMFGAVGLAVLVMNSIAAFDGLRPVIILRLAPTAERDQDLFLSALVYSAIIGVLVGGGAALFARYGFGFDWASAIMLGGASFLHFVASAVGSFLDAVGDTAYTGVARSIGWCLVYLSFMGLAVTNVELAGYLAALVLFQILLVALYAHRMWRQGGLPVGPSGLTFGKIASVASESANMIGFNLAALVLGVADRLAVNLAMGSRAYGLYSGAYDLAVRPTVLFRVVATVSLPEMVQRGPLSLIGRWWRMLLITFWVTSLAAVVIATFNETLIVFALGGAFRVSATSFALLAATLPLFALSYFGAVLCQATGELKLQRQIFTYGAIAIVLVLPPLTLRFGLEGAAASVLLARLVDPALIAALLGRHSVRLPYGKCFMALTLYGAAVLFAVADWTLPSLIGCLGLSLVIIDLWQHRLSIGGAGAAESVSEGS